MATKVTHKCGCEVDYTTLLGRGNARLVRIQKLERQYCPKCSVAEYNKKLWEDAQKQTLIDGTPYTYEQQLAFYNKRKK